MEKRFLSRAEVAEELNVSEAQVYALVRRGDLRAAKVGGRGTWRIGRDDLETYIADTYAETAHWIDEHPFTEDVDLSDELLAEPDAEADPGDDASAE